MAEQLELKVAEAMQIDYGKRIVRIDSNARNMLGLTTGDIIEIKAKKTTAALVLPSHPQDEGLNIIRMDGILRQNTGVALGDRVKIKKATINVAKKIILAPNQPSRYAPGFDHYVKKNLVGKPLSKGDILSVNIFGTAFPFAVAQTIPAGLVLVSPETELILKEEPMKELGRIATISYEDIGGLKEEVQKIREMVELPMRHPEIFERLGIEPPKGVLIYGTPGTGKTLLAKAVASESEAHFITINGPEIVSKFVGEAEERLRSIFKEAEDNSPSIIFIDELDAIAPKREEVVGEVEKRIVSQLLCVSPDTLIYTSEGTRPIKELYDYAKGEKHVENNVEYLFNPEGLKVNALSKEGTITPCKVTAMNKLFVPDAFEVSTENGLTVKCSAIQRFLTLQEGRFEWVPITGLREGDYVATPTRIALEEREHDLLSFLPGNYSFKLSKRLQPVFGRAIVNVSDFNYFKDNGVVNEDGTMRTALLNFIRGRQDCTLEEIFSRLARTANDKIKIRFLIRALEQKQRIKVERNGRKYVKITAVAVEKPAGFDDVEGVSVFNYFQRYVKDEYYVKPLRRLTPELAELLGYVMADGSLSKNRLNFSGKPELVERAQDLVVNLFGKPGRLKKINERYYRLDVATQTIPALLHHLFGIPLGKKSHIVTLPKQLFTASEECKKAFVRAYFDCDGSVSSNLRAFSRSKAMMQDLSTLLHSLCFQTSYSFAKGMHYCNVLGGTDAILEYAERIGSLRPSRVEKFQELLTARKVSSSIQFMPNLQKALNALKAGMKNLQGNDYAYLSGAKPLNKGKLAYFLGLYSQQTSAATANLRQLLEAEVSWTKITSVKPIPGMTMYDLTTETENFIAGNVPTILHNTLMDGLKSRGEVVVIGASVTGNTTILVKDKEKTRLMPIGEFVDGFYAEGEEGVEKPVENTYTLGFSSEKNRFKNDEFKAAGFKKVRSVFRHKVNEIYEIQYSGGTVRATGNHSVFVRTRRGVEAKPVSELREGEVLVELPYKVRSTNGPELRHANTVTAFPLRIPVAKTVREAQTAILGATNVAEQAQEAGISVSQAFRWRHGTAPKLLQTAMANALCEEVEVTPELFRLIGYYVAEGYSRKELDFCFGTHETRLISDTQQLIEKYFNVRPSKAQVTGSRTNVVYYSKLLSSFFAGIAGKGAFNKHVPEMLFEMPKEFFLEFLKGVAEGDGYESPTGRIEITSVSRRLVTELNWLCRMHGIKSFIGEFIVKEGRLINGKPLPETHAYRLGIGARNNPFKQRPVNEMKIGRPIIKKITRLPFDGFVYDLCGCENEAFFGGESPVLLHNTNRPNAIDPALRRPGRFDREIEIGVPDKKSRKEILQIHTRGMPLEGDVSLDEIASVTHGFVGADVQSLAKEAAMKALRRLLPKINLQDEQIPQKILDELKVTKDDFHNALREIQPSALREVLVEVPNVKWSQIGGLEEVKRELREAVDLPLKKPEVFQRMGIRPVRGILMYGPPGTGKTLLAKAIATESEANFISIKGPEIISKWVGESLAYDEEITVFDGAETKNVKIGEFVDSNLAENGTQLMSALRKCKVQTFDENGRLAWAGITDVIRHPAPSQLYEVETKSGRRITITGDHGLFVLDEGMVKTIPTRSLVPGESFIAIPARLTGNDVTPEFNLLEQMPDVLVGNISPFVKEAIKKLGRDKVNELLGYKRKYDVLERVKTEMNVPACKFVKLVHHMQTRIPEDLRIRRKGGKDSLPPAVKFNEDWAYLAGLWLAEGDYNNGFARISNQNPEIRLKAKQCLRRLGLNYCETSGGVLCSSLTASVLKLFGMSQYAQNKRFPAFAFNLPKGMLKEMLNGYFSGDGSVYGNAHRYYVEASTASVGLAGDLMRLLSYFGITATHYERVDQRYNLKMHKVLFSGVSNFQKFSEIGFADQKRRERVALYAASKKWARSWQMPLDKNLRQALKENGVSEWKKSKTIGNNIIQRIKSSDATLRHYKAISEYDVLWDLVVSIRKVDYCKPYVYDLSVDTTQRMLAGFGGVFVHNSERAVREIFRKAKLASPCIIFMDEIDSIAPIRGSAEGGSNVGERIVDSLLTEMDGLQDLKDIVIIGATNRVDMVDPALLRPGRFDKIIAIPIPDEATRHAIFEIHTRKMPLRRAEGKKGEENMVDLKKLAKMTDGYSGADVEALCREAAMMALRQNIDSKEVTADHFLKAFASIRPTLSFKREREKDAGYS